jgi:dolichol kinase
VAPPHYPLSTSPLAPRREFVRKSLHLLATVVPVAYALGMPRAALETVLSISVAIALLIEGLRRASAPFGTAFERAFGALMRPHEQRAITGATWLALSCLVAVAALSRNAAIAALWCATVGDAAATIFGRWTTGISTHENERAGKTVTGSLACAVASFAGVWMLAGYPPPIAVVIALAAAIAESWPVSIDDNIRVATAAGAIAQLFA